MKNARDAERDAAATGPVIDIGDLPPIPVRHPGRWGAAVVVAVLAAMLIHGVVANANYEWPVVGQYLLSRPILDGLLITLVLTVVAMGLGIALGVVLAVMRMSANPIVTGASWLYIWFFRGTPVLVQLLVWFNLAALYPTLSLGVPFGPSFITGSANQFITPFVAAMLGLGLNEAAYMAEIVRAGILSVDQGQTEASQALGMSKLKMLQRIILPQAMRVIIPPTGNEIIGMLKTTSLASVIALAELLYSAQIIYGRTFQTIPLLIVASIWYLLLTSLLTIGQHFIERYFAKGSSRTIPLTPYRRLRNRFRARADFSQQPSAVAGGR